MSPRGLTTSTIPHRSGAFDIEFDFVDHVLRIRSSDGAVRTLALQPRPVAEFYGEVMRALDELGIETRIQARPNEIDPAIPFAEDHTHRAYDPRSASPAQQPAGPVPAPESEPNADYHRGGWAV